MGGRWVIHQEYRNQSIWQAGNEKRWDEIEIVTIIYWGVCVIFKYESGSACLLSITKHSSVFFTPTVLVLLANDGPTSHLAEYYERFERRIYSSNSEWNASKTIRNPLHKVLLLIQPPAPTINL